MIANNGIFNYTYDKLNHLTGVSSNDRDMVYSYDSLGNRVISIQDQRVIHHQIISERTKRPKVETITTEIFYDYNAANQLTGTSTRIIEGAFQNGYLTDYHYDRRGNMIQVIERHQSTARYTFDATNMMASAILPDKGVAKYDYNGFRNRVSKLAYHYDDRTKRQNNEMLENVSYSTYKTHALSMLDPTDEVRYVLDMTLPYNNLLMQQGAVEQRFSWGNGLISGNNSNSNSNKSQNSSQDNTDNINNIDNISNINEFFYLHDHLGSPIRLFGDNYNNPIAFDEFGVQVVKQENLNFTNPFSFTGYQLVFCNP